MDLLTAIRERRATRAYSSEPVGRAAIEQLIDAATRAPSAMNLQPWAFVIFRGAERLKAFSEQAKHQLRSSPHPEMGPEAQTMLSSPAFDMFHGAPLLVLTCATSGDRQAAEDCCLAGQNLMLAAHAAGLATCPIGLSRAWFELPETKRELGIPQDLVPVLPLIVGHAQEAPVNHGRRVPRVLWL